MWFVKLQDLEEKNLEGSDFKLFECSFILVVKCLFVCPTYEALQLIAIIAIYFINNIIRKLSFYSILMHPDQTAEIVNTSKDQMYVCFIIRAFVISDIFCIYGNVTIFLRLLSVISDA